MARGSRLRTRGEVVPERGAGPAEARATLAATAAEDVARPSADSTAFLVAAVAATAFGAYALLAAVILLPAPRVAAAAFAGGAVLLLTAAAATALRAARR